MDILNIKLWSFNGNTRVAYCGNNYDYWCTRFPVIKNMSDYSILGKPRVLIVKGDREQTIENYRLYFNDKIDETPFYNALVNLKSYKYNALACWCAPLKCHCEVIRDFIELV